MVTKQDILGYVSFTPYNTNINVLGPLLDEFYDEGYEEGTEESLIKTQTKVIFTNNTSVDARLFCHSTVNNANEEVSYVSIPAGGGTYRIFNTIQPTTNFKFYIGLADGSNIDFVKDGKQTSLSQSPQGFYPINFKVGEEHTLVLNSGK